MSKVRLYLHDKNLLLFAANTKATGDESISVADLNNKIVNDKLGDKDADQLREDVELVDGVHG